MGDVAASGGYWISHGRRRGDRRRGHHHRLDRRVRAAAHGRRRDGQAGRAHRRRHHHLAGRRLRPAPRHRPALRRSCVQTSIDHTYVDFIAKVARGAQDARRQQIDAVAQGRVWTGAQALERGLVDRLGSYGDALTSRGAARQAGRRRQRRFRVTYLEREPGRLQRLLELFGGYGVRQAWRGQFELHAARRGPAAVGASCARICVADRADRSGASPSRWRCTACAATRSGLRLRRRLALARGATASAAGCDAVSESITAVAAAKAAVCVASSCARAVQVRRQQQRQRRQRRMAVRSQQLPGLDAEGTAQLLQFVDAGGHHRPTDAVQRAVAHAAARGDLRQRVQVGACGHQCTQVVGEDVSSGAWRLPPARILPPAGLSRPRTRAAVLSWPRSPHQLHVPPASPPLPPYGAALPARQPDAGTAQRRDCSATARSTGASSWSSAWSTWACSSAGCRG